MGPMGFATKDKSWMTVWRGRTQITITTEFARVAGTHFGKHLLRQIELWRQCPSDKQGSLTNPLDLIYMHCLPDLQRLAPETSIPNLTLEGFLHSPTYQLELVDAGKDGDTRIEGEDECLDTPSFSMSSMRTADLPQSCKELTRFHASRIWIVPSKDETGSLRGVQGQVTTAEGILMYFKPRVEMREPEFEREIMIMSRIEETGLRARIRVPELRGIVVSGEKGETTIGFLMTLIISPENGHDLQSQAFWALPELHKKWEEQVTTITRELHAHDIVWGDVNPTNVVTDEAMDAWVIDFGGMNNVEFVDEDKRETVEGDWQGISRLFHEWLPSRVKASEIH